MPDNKDELADLQAVNDNLEHALIEGKLKGIKAQVESMSDTIHQRINDGEKQSVIEFSHVKEGLDRLQSLGEKTLAQATQTNGRVTQIELERQEEKIRKEYEDKEHNDVKKNTRAVRFMHKYPKITVAMALVGYLFSMPEIRQFTTSTVGKFFSLFGKIF